MKDRPVRPEELVKSFRSDLEFIAWAWQGTAKDLRACIEAFAEDKLYWHCEILEDVLVRLN